MSVSSQYQIDDLHAGARAEAHLPAGVGGAGRQLLLKPNGAPVFHAVGQVDTPLDETLRRGLEKPPRAGSAQNDLERTVRAHNFVVGKATQNSTSIAVLEVTKHSEAQEQNFPVRVIYVKPSIGKNPTLRAKAAERSNLGEPGPRRKSTSAIDNQNRQQNHFDNDINRQMDPEVSMGEISGIFKQSKHTRPKKKRPASESQKQAQQRAQTQKAYAEQVRQQAKIKEQQRQIQQRAQAQSADGAVSRQANAADDQEAELPDALRPKIPHSSNRFEGQYGSLTKDLFRKAQAQIKEEKERERASQDDRRAKQEKEQRYLEAIKERNQELVMRQKERGTAGASLKEREEALRDDERREDLRQDRERKKSLRVKRAEEDRAQLGLDQLDRNKLKEFQDKKHRDQLEQEAARMQRLEENEQKAIKRRKELPRKGVIDFMNADLGDSALMGPDDDDCRRPDEVAQLIVDKKQILKEQKIKRKQQDLERQKEEQRLKAKKESSIMQLEQHLKQQRDELARKQILGQERQEKWAAQQREASKAASKRPPAKQDRSEQLSELRDWINDQMNLDGLKIFSDPAMQASPRSEQVPAPGGQMASHPTSEPYEEADLRNLIKHQLPGNSMIPMDNERKVEARQNRYGLQGVNEFDQIVQQQRIKDGLPARSTKSASGRENALEGHKRDSSPQKSDKKSDDSYDYQPVRGDRRVIINQAAQDTDSREQLPGVMSVQKEAARQDSERIKRTNATVVIQSWARGWQARRRRAPARGGMSVAAKAKRAAFADHPDLGDPIDFHKFLYDKPKQFVPLRPDDDDISENIGHSGSHGDVQTQSYIPSQILGESGAADNRRSAAMLQNFFGPSKTSGELDPLSIIALFAKKNTIAPPPQQVIPEKDRPTVSSKPERRTRATFDHRDSRRSAHKAGRAARTSPQKPMKQNIVEEDIEEDIIQSSKDLSGLMKLPAGQATEDRYSSDFVSEHITESIASYRGQGIATLKPDKRLDSSLIEESIQESLAATTKDQAAQRKARIQASATQDSIQEDEDLMRAASVESASIEDEVQESKVSDMISEESILNRQSDLHQSGSAKKPKIQQKAARIRHNIEQDYKNDGFESYSQSLKAQSKREQEQLAERKRAEDYRMSSQIIKDFEERKATGSLEHQRVVKGLEEELKRYEAAVSGGIFFERFQNTVDKSLAQKDVMMLGQRLSQLEQEAKHKQEIADIRTEQARMFGQLMLLSAGQGNNGREPDAKIKRQQEEIMRNIQSLIEKPIIIQRDGIEQSQQSNLNQLNNIQESVGSKKSRKSGQQQRFSSIEQSLNKAAHVERVEKYSGHEDIEEDVIASEIQESMEDSIKESLDQSQLQQSQNEQQQLSNARRMLGSEQAVIEKSKSVLEQRPKRPSSPFEKNSFQDYTSKKFKNLLSHEGTMMDDFLDQIETAVVAKQGKEKKQLQTQLQSGGISPKTFHRKSRDLEKWVSGERKEIGQKRRKVQDTCSEIGTFLNKLEKDKQLMLDGLNSSSNTPRGLRRSASQASASQDSEKFQLLKGQLDELRSGQVGGSMPETKYLNKKRDFVRQLMKEKKDAIEKGVREKMRHLEGDMIDEMIRTALSLDVDQEVDRRIDKARQLLEQGQIDESASKSVSVRRGGPAKSNKKNVKFQSPSQMEKYSSSASYSQQQESMASKSLNQKHLDGSIGEADDDMIGESIKIDESYQPSSSASKAAHSGYLRESAGKVSRSGGKKSERIEEQNQEEDDSLSRDDEDVDGSYSNDFVSESIQSASLSQAEKGALQSAKALQSKAADIEESGYSERFEDASMGQTASKQMRKIQEDLARSRQNNDIEIVNEEDDNVEGSSNVLSNAEGSRPSESQRESARERASPESEARDEYQDKEILESTSSVEWQVTLQKRTSQPAVEEESAPGPSARDAKEESDELQAASSEVVEELDEVEADELEDLASCPSGSLTESKPNEEDFSRKVDEITAHLLEQVLNDFRGDDCVKMEVEDDVDEDEFEDKWPYTLDKRQEQQPEEPAPAAPTQASSQEEARQVEAAQQENEAKKRHDQQMQKFHEEQKQIEEHHKKVLEYVDFIVEIVDKEVLQQALEKPIEHDPLKILEKIQALDTEDEIELTSMAYSQQQSALPAVLFDEIEKRLDAANQSKEEDQVEPSQDGEEGKEQNNVSRVAQTAHHLAIFDAFNEALDQERPYKFKGLPNPWSKQTRVTHETLSAQQVDQIIGRARARVIEWDKTGAGTKFAPAPPPPPLQSEYDPPHLQQAQQESEDERNKAERQERLGLLLTKEVHQREQDWLDYEIEDTQARFDLADMILEELAGEVAQFLEDRFESNAD